MAIDPQVAALLRQHKTAIDGMRQTINQMAQVINDQQSRPRSIQEEFDSVEGRRIEALDRWEDEHSLHRGEPRTGRTGTPTGPVRT